MRTLRLPSAKGRFLLRSSSRRWVQLAADESAGQGVQMWLWTLTSEQMVWEMCKGDQAASAKCVSQAKGRWNRGHFDHASIRANKSKAEGRGPRVGKGRGRYDNPLWLRIERVEGRKVESEYAGGHWRSPRRKISLPPYPLYPQEEPGVLNSERTLSRTSEPCGSP